MLLMVWIQLSNLLVKERSEAITHSRAHQNVKELMENARAELNTMYDVSNLYYYSGQVCLPIRPVL